MDITTNTPVSIDSGADNSSDDVSTTITDQVMKIIYVILASTGILGNTLVIFVLFRFTNMRKKVTNLFIINQSVLDLLTAIFLLLTTVLPDDGRSYWSRADDVYCRIWVSRLPLWLFIHSSTYNLVALTLERYMSVVHPIYHKLSFTRNKAYLAIALVWLVAILYDLAGSIPTSYISDGQCLLYVFKTVTDMKAVGIVGVFLNYFIPIFILIFCYSKMAYTLTRKIGPMSNSADTAQNATKQSLQARGKRNVIKTLIIVSTAFILCTSWNQIFFFLFNLGLYDYRALSGTFYHFSVVAMFANCCVNPFIYTAKYQEFQKGVKRIFCSCINDNKISDVSESNHTDTVDMK